MLKRCSYCKEEKLLKEFWKHKGRKDGYNNECKKCLTKRQKEPQNIKRKKEYQQKYRLRPEIQEKLKKLYKSLKYKLTIKKGQLRRNYNLTLEQYNTMVQMQNGRCLICNIPEVIIDHCHRTGKIRGLICHRCNKIIGFAQDNIDLLKNIIKYLEKTDGISTAN